MSQSHRHGTQTHLDPEIRALMRRERASIDMELSVQDRGDCVRMTIPQVAWEDFGEIPDTVTVRYLPAERALVVELPEPEPRATELGDFENDR